MLFVTLLKPRAGAPGTPKERIARRAQWQYPAGSRLVAEYWLLNNDPQIISIVEADSIAPVMAALVEWGDVLEGTTVPAVTLEEGLQLAKQMMR